MERQNAMCGSALEAIVSGKAPSKGRKTLRTFEPEDDTPDLDAYFNDFPDVSDEEKSKIAATYAIAMGWGEEGEFPDLDTYFRRFRGISVEQKIQMARNFARYLSSTLRKEKGPARNKKRVMDEDEE